MQNRRSTRRFTALLLAHTQVHYDDAVTKSDSGHTPWALRQILGDPWLYLALLPALPIIVSPWFWPIGRAWSDSLWVTGLLLILVYPVLEELCFRGWLQPLIASRITARWGPLTLANALTSVLFAAAHAVYLPWAAAALLFFPSLVFGGLRDRHQRLLSPILVHAAYNAALVWTAF